MFGTRTQTQAHQTMSPSGVGGLLQRKCACGGSAGLSGKCEKCARNDLQGIQTKLDLGAADDAFEREADRVADQITSGGSASPDDSHALNGPQRQPLRIQRLSTRPAASQPAMTSRAAAVLREPGEALRTDLRTDMESRFGHDFSRVRIHTGSAADQSAQALNAHAYTLNRNIVFAAGQFSPETRKGRHLLAHELTHVVQQSGAGASTGPVQRSSKNDEPSTKPHSCGGWTCADTAHCKKPDSGKAPSGDASKNWSLTANLDLDVESATDVTGSADVGHAFVEFEESNGDRYTYGHYHNKTQSPNNFNRPEVPGCAAHPDSTHADCVDMKIRFDLSKAEYDKALGFAQLWCSAPPRYNLFNQNCATFVEHVAKQAGKPLPSSRGKVGYGRLSTDADNPYTLFDAHVSQADKATWRNRVTGDFSGHYDAGGSPIAFDSFKLVTDEKLVVAGRYKFQGSSGNTVEGELDGQLVFKVEGPTKKVDPVVTFKWTEPGGAGRGRWSVSSSAALKGTWGRGAADTGAGKWELTKKTP